MVQPPFQCKWGHGRPKMGKDSTKNEGLGLGGKTIEGFFFYNAYTKDWCMVNIYCTFSMKVKANASKYKYTIHGSYKNGSWGYKGFFTWRCSFVQFLAPQGLWEVARFPICQQTLMYFKWVVTPSTNWRSLLLRYFFDVPIQKNWGRSSLEIQWEGRDWGLISDWIVNFHHLYMTWYQCFKDWLGGGFKYFLCSPLLGEDSQFD